MIAAERQRPIPDELLGIRPGLDEILPVDTERQERDSLFARRRSIQAEYLRLLRRMERWNVKPEIYWDWIESQEEFQQDATAFDEISDRMDEVTGQWLSACEVIDRRPNLSGSLRVCLAKCLYRLKVVAKNLLSMVRREIAEAVKVLRDYCRSTIVRCLAFLLLNAMMDLLATLATEARGQIRPELPPRVISAGGIVGLFVPRW